MHNLLLVAVVCLGIVSLTVARQHKGRFEFKNKDSSEWDDAPFVKDRYKTSKFCVNQTIAQAYLAQVLPLIVAFQANTTYNSVLKGHSANFVSYLTASANEELLRRDCQAFVKGLKTARKADQMIRHEEKQLALMMERSMNRLARDVNNGKGFEEFDD